MVFTETKFLRKLMDYNKYKICVVGLGYVGMPLLLALSRFFPCTGYDNDKSKVLNLSKKHKKINFISKLDRNNSNVYIMCVPTPVNKKNLPDLGPLKNATTYVAKFLKKKNLIIFESTVNPGTTEFLSETIIEKISGLLPCYKRKNNNYFYLGYSPERINPGDKKNTLKNITKIISANSSASLKKINSIYSLILNKTYQVKNIKVAEASKMLENIQRDINIALVNQAQMIFDKININTIDVIKAAKTKWNFAPFYPGLVGGHCVSVDPYYLSDLAKKLKVDQKIILMGRNTNNYMPKYYANSLIKNKVKGKNSSILIMGFAFKENTDDIRNTKVAELVYELRKIKNVSKIDIFDPLVDKSDVYTQYNLYLIDKLEKKYDAIIIAVRHNFFKKIGLKKIRNLLKKNGNIFDLKYLFGDNIII